MNIIDNTEQIDNIESIKKDIILENKFSENLEDLLILFSSQKINITRFVEKNFRENIHFIKIKNSIKFSYRGGHNKINYMLTKSTFELAKNTFNLQNRYISKFGDTQHVNIIMSLENQTIGFIENSFKNIIKTKRQYGFNNKSKIYRVDLFFPKYKLVIECDENNHSDRNICDEKEREDYILSLNNTIIRFNPNDKLFDLSLVLREINKILFMKKKNESSLIIVVF